MGIKHEAHYHDVRLMILRFGEEDVRVWRSFVLGEYWDRPKGSRFILSDIQNDGLVDIILYSDAIQYFSAGAF